jgi:Cu(I)/Ag(I) efflux system membrane fusion protein
VVEGGDLLSVPNEAIIETEGRQVVYVQQPGGNYVPRDITTGIRGELFTEVLEGVEAGEQVVTIGSFFIDAEHKLKN